MKILGEVISYAVTGGQTDGSDLYIAPTVLGNPPLDSELMQEEIFGPILPVFSVEGVEQSLEIMKRHPNPLALYVFSEEDREIEQILNAIPSGGVCINDVALHLAVPELPFGGIRSSGIGAYHGHHTFKLFSHDRSVLRCVTWPDPSFRYPPYTEDKKRQLRRIMRAPSLGKLLPPLLVGSALLATALYILIKKPTLPSYFSSSSSGLLPPREIERLG